LPKERFLRQREGMFNGIKDSDVENDDARKLFEVTRIREELIFVGDGGLVAIR
jgi:hypothetical protein